MLNTGRTGNIGLFVMILFLTAWIPCSPLLYAQGAVTFGELKYEEELVQIWDGMAASLGMERTDLQNHYTSTYPKPKVIASVKQQTGFSPSGAWSDLAYRNVYCVSHSGEAANNPVSSMVCSSAWYAKQPWTLQNLPDYMRDRAGGDEYLLRFNFLMLAYGADYHAYQNGVNSSSVVGTADYYLCQGICTLTEEVQFTGNYGADWLAYKAVVMGWADCFSPNGLGSSQVYKEMNAHAEQVFSTVWHTAKLMAECTQSSEDGFQFVPTIRYGEDGMYHAAFPLTEATRPILMASAIAVEGDWNYQFTNENLDFYSATGEIPASGFLAKINPQNANGIICASIGSESVRELHQPVQVRGKWSLTYSQANLVSALLPGTQIVIGNQKEASSGSPDFSSSGEVVRYKHTEKWQTDYVVNLRKLDAETGCPLEGAQFDILEAFDASQLDGSILEDDNWDNAGGSQFLRWNGWDSPYEESGADPCPKDQEITDENGWLTEMESSGAGPLHSNGTRAHHDVKYYSYTKGYCGGHPEPESDGGDGEGEDEDDEEAEEEYEREIEICEALAAQGGFFHSLEGGEEALKADRDRHYEAFVALTYEYSARELTARSGYILHNQEEVHEPHENRYDGIHEDTIPIETVTVHSRQYYELEQGNIADAESDISESGTVELNIEQSDMSESGTMGLDMEQSDIEDADILNEDVWSEICDEDMGDIEAVLEATVSNATLSNAEIFDSSMIYATASNWLVSDGTSSDAESRQIFPKKVITLKRKDSFASDSFNYNTSAGMILADVIDWQISRLEPMESFHCNSRDTDAEWVFFVYDHRTEGELHGNKRDLNLSAGENGEYNSYRDTQGDAILEGAVYGLFAAEDIVHPDGKTGVVYQKGNLTSVAVTNKNGDFSFTHYTEKPGMIYDYEHGKIVSTGFQGPSNLYIADDKKYSSNEQFFQGERWHYEIQDLEGKNGNCWIGRPLILGSYYVQELVRSEGYELSVFGIHENITNRSAWLNQGDTEAKGTVELTSMEELVLKTDDGVPYTVTQLLFESEDTLNGYDIQIKGIDPTTVPSFYTTVQGTKEVYTEWQEPVISYEPVKAKAGTKVLIQGVGVPAKLGDIVELPNGERQTVQNTVLEAMNSERVKLTGKKGAIPSFDVRYLPELTGIVPVDETDFLAVCNAAFAEVGLLPVGKEAPYRWIPLGNNPAAWAAHLYDYMESEACPCFNAAYLESIVYQENEPYAVLRYSFLKDGEAQSVVYSVSDSAFYVKYDVLYPENIEGYLYRKYQAQDLKPENYEMGKHLYRWIQIEREKPKNKEISPYQVLEELEFVSAQEFISYWAYGQNDDLRSEDGSIYQKEVTTYVEKAGYLKEQTFFDTPLSFIYYPERKSYECHISPDQIPKDGNLMLSIRYEDIYAGNRTGLIALAIPSADVSGTYIQQTPLIYPGQEQIYEDYGTRITPIVVLERVISEKVKLQKEIEESSSFVHTADGFRFKIYLKSNLERLYRDSSGTIVWLNREEEELDSEALREELDRYPEKVPVITTKNTADDGSGAAYTRLLETTEDGYNYEKFFDAVAVANHDIWDDASPEFSSFRPVGNEENRTEYTLQNTKISDAVRQFAIDWYLKDCVKMVSVDAAYSDELYDLALYQACTKALDYLIPFFAYDLDSIYAILWDSEEDGGADRDASTLSVNRKSENGYDGISEYLPYGIYVIVEQQPQYAYLGDLKRKHYQIDEPKELIIPALKNEYDAQEPYKETAWSVTDPMKEAAAKEGETYRGYANRKFYNPVYDAKLRIEKLDAVTHENLIHDDAVFVFIKANEKMSRMERGRHCFMKNQP